MKAIVVGGGIMGLSTAWALCAAGQDVALFEQGPLPKDLKAKLDDITAEWRTVDAER